MNWTEFIRYVGLLYFAYYGINIIIDLLRSGKTMSIKGEEDVLHFSEQVETTFIDTEDLMVGDQEIPEGEAWEVNGQDAEVIELVSENINVSTGGVHDMVEICRLAQSKTIEVTKDLVF